MFFDSYQKFYWTVYSFLQLMNVMNWMSVFSKFIYLSFNAYHDYLEMGSLWKLLRFNEVIRVGPWPNRISVLIRRNTRNPALFPCACTEDIMSRWQFESQEDSLYKKPHQQAQLSWTSRLPEPWEINFCHFCNTVCSILLWQSELTNTMGNTI